MSRRAAALADLRPAEGPRPADGGAAGERQLRADRRKLQRQPGRRCGASFQVLGGSRPGAAAGASPSSATCWSWARAPALHAGLAGPLQANGIDLVFTAGPLMRASARGAAGADARRAMPASSGRARAAGRGGGARGRRRRGQGIGRQPHAPVVEALLALDAGVGSRERPNGRRVGEDRGDALSPSAAARRRTSAPFNVFRYITFRTGGAVVTALLISFVIGPG